MLPKSLVNVIDALSQLPGVGPRTAERYSYFFYKNQHSASKLENSLKSLNENIATCPVTFMLIDKDTQVSRLYSDPRRNKQKIIVVADPFDVVAIEKTSSYDGTYHVMNGLISPIDDITPQSLHIDELSERIKRDKVKELIIATNTSVEGESTAVYISNQLKDHKITISRIAQGLPIGLDIGYADQITLSKALEGRRVI